MLPNQQAECWNAMPNLTMIKLSNKDIFQTHFKSCKLMRREIICWLSFYLCFECIHLCYILIFVLCYVTCHLIFVYGKFFGLLLITELRHFSDSVFVFWYFSYQLYWILYSKSGLSRYILSRPRQFYAWWWSCDAMNPGTSMHINDLKYTVSKNMSDHNTYLFIVEMQTICVTDIELAEIYICKYGCM